MMFSLATSLLLASLSLGLLTTVSALPVGTSSSSVVVSFKTNGMFNTRNVTKIRNP